MIRIDNEPEIYQWWGFWGQSTMHNKGCSHRGSPSAKKIISIIKKKYVFLQNQNMNINNRHINVSNIFLNIKKRDVYDYL